MASTDFNRKNILSTIPTAIENLKTTLQSWANGRFSLTSHTHSASSIGIPLFAPDFSRRKLMYRSSDDTTNTGFRIRNCTNTTTTYPAKIFQLKYPCFIYNEIKTFGLIDTDMVLEMSSNRAYCIAFNKQDDNNPNRYLAAVYRDSTYRTIRDHASQGSSFLVPIAALNYWYHYATGAAGSGDDGDNKYRDYYLIPAYGTPSGTVLADIYDATYTGERAQISSSNTSLLWLNKLNTATFSKTITA